MALGFWAIWLFCLSIPRASYQADGIPGHLGSKAQPGPGRPPRPRPRMAPAPMNEPQLPGYRACPQGLQGRDDERLLANQRQDCRQLLQEMSMAINRYYGYNQYKNLFIRIHRCLHRGASPSFDRSKIFEYVSIQ